VTLKKSQKRKLKVGVDFVKAQDDAMWSTLRNSVPAGTKILVIAAIVGSLFLPAAGRTTHRHDP
jgi:hypothetical protein